MGKLGPVKGALPSAEKNCRRRKKQASSYSLNIPLFGGVEIISTAAGEAETNLARFFFSLLQAYLYSGRTYLPVRIKHKHKRRLGRISFFRLKALRKSEINIKRHSPRQQGSDLNICKQRNLTYFSNALSGTPVTVPESVWKRRKRLLG